MKLLLLVSVGVSLAAAAVGCDDMKAREPKQATDPVVQTPKDGDTKLNSLDPGDDAGSPK
jgi:hypothetical protein